MDFFQLTIYCQRNFKISLVFKLQWLMDQWKPVNFPFFYEVLYSTTSPLICLFLVCFGTQSLKILSFLISNKFLFTSGILQDKLQVFQFLLVLLFLEYKHNHYKDISFDTYLFLFRRHFLVIESYIRDYNKYQLVQNEECQLTTDVQLKFESCYTIFFFLYQITELLVYRPLSSYIPQISLWGTLFCYNFALNDFYVLYFYNLFQCQATCWSYWVIFCWLLNTPETYY